MECILHIGCEKTGTTSVQAALEARAGALKGAGILAVEAAGFPNAVHLPLASMSASRHEHNFVRLGVADDARARRRWADALWKSIGEEVARAGPSVSRLLFSTEYLQSKLVLVEEIRDLAARLDALGVSRVRVLVYVRRQIDVAVSRVSTALKAGFANAEVVPLPENALSFYDGFYDHEALLERWARVFGEEALTVRSYERARASSVGVVGDFLALLDVDPIGPGSGTPIAERNVALSGNAQRVLLTLNRALADAGCSREEGARLRRLLLPALERDAAGARLLPARDRAIAFQAQFDEGNRRVSERWFAGKPIFSGGFDEFPAASPDTAPSAEQALLATAVTGLRGKL